MGKTFKRLVKAGLAVGAASAAVIAVKNRMEAENSENEVKVKPLHKNSVQQAYFIGGGLASLAGAAYLIRDCNMKGENIHIFEKLSRLGGSNDGSGSPEEGFVCRGGRMLNEETYENFWELFSDIPSMVYPGKSITEEILSFDHAHPTCAKARLIDGNGRILDVKSMGFSSMDRKLLGRLLTFKEDELDEITIAEWFKESPHFFETNFWYMWQTTYSFQKWSSVFEFKRYMNRMLLEIPRINTLEGATRTRYNQYDSIIKPLKVYLLENGVDFNLGISVTDVAFDDLTDKTTVTAIQIERGREKQVIELKKNDLCIMTNGSMTDCSTFGNLKTAPEFNARNPVSAELWRKVAEKKPGLGNPDAFFSKPEDTNWESFTITMKGNHLLKLIEQFSANVPGSGALMTFKDSAWLMSIVVSAQPHFRKQKADQTVLWGYCLRTEKKGDYIRKPLRECTGEEILIELIHHLHFENMTEAILDSVINVIPCIMPYAGAQFQPHKMGDRPKVIPEGSTNFAMIGQFVELPDDTVFTEEYSIRSAKTAVYALMGVEHKKVCPVTSYNKDPIVLSKALKAVFR